MGGLGSGRYYWSCKTTLEDYEALDIRLWHRKKLLAPCNEFTCTWSRRGEKIAAIQVFVKNTNAVLLSYRHRDAEYNWTDHNYPIQIVWSPCNYGGTRPWFLCPVLGCNRRVAVLYGGEIFACRHCNRLDYKSQSESASTRATRRADKLREKLDWEPGILNGEGIKPKGMHWSTFERLCNQHQHFVHCSFLGMQERFGLYSNIL